MRNHQRRRRNKFRGILPAIDEVVYKIFKK